MVMSIFSFYNLYKVIDNNSNPYMNMVMDAVGMNQGYVGQYQIVDK